MGTSACSAGGGVDQVEQGRGADRTVGGTDVDGNLGDTLVGSDSHEELRYDLFVVDHGRPIGSALGGHVVKTNTLRRP